MRRRLPLAGLAALLVLEVAAPARAQGWLEDRSGAEGPGFRAGNLEIHPGLGMEWGYDSNIFFERTNIDDSFLLRLTGHVHATNLGQQRSTEGETERDDQTARNVSFRGGVNASYYHFFEQRARDNVGGDLFLDLTINPQGRFFVQLQENLGRAVRPFVDAPTEDARAPSYARINNLAGLAAGLRSPGDMLRGSLGYQMEIDIFEDDEWNYANTATHRGTFDISWRFLPRTAIIHNTTVAFRTYYNADDEPLSQVNEGTTLMSNLGLNGAITNTLSFSAMAGYSAGFFSRPGVEEFESVHARAELRHRPRATINWNLGYDRRFNPSFIGNYVKSDRVYAKLQMLFGGSFLAIASASVSFDESGLALAVDGTDIGTQTRRSDIRVRASLFSEYRFTDWLAANLAVSYIGDITDFEFIDTRPLGMDSLIDPAGGYSKVETWLGVRAYY